METYVGQIVQFAFNYAPESWLPCEGQTLNISSNQALYALIGTKFGGNGSTTFCLPDMRKASLFSTGMKYYIAISGTFPQQD
ncbi:MAG TPA: phage tail protein [Bacteroidales bacterium]|nr:phage tail protein [Bacteroidales bacterium]